MTEVLGIVGVGRLASFVVEGLRRGGDGRPILLSPRNTERATELARRFDCDIASSNQAVVDGAEIVMVATPPKAVLPCVDALAWRPGQTLLCVAIDVTLAQLAAAAPGAVVVRAMPSNAAVLGICPTPVFPANAAVKSLIGTLGPVHELENEAAFDAATALAAYHLWCYALMDEMVQASQTAGLPRGAAVGMVAGMTRAAAEFALRADPSRPVREPLDENGIPGTLTAEGMALIDGRRALAAWRDAYAAAVTRLRGEGHRRN